MKTAHYRYVLLVLAAYVVITRFFMPFPADFEDSYIMQRYVQNGVDGYLFEWNRHFGTVQGTTGIAWLTLISELARLTRFSVGAIDSYAGLGFAILALLAVYLAASGDLKLRNPRVAVLQLLPIATSPLFIRGSTNGLETSITVFFTALSIYLLRFCNGARGSSLCLGLFSGFTFLVRPDLPLFPVALFCSAFVLSPGALPQKGKAVLCLLLGTLAAAGASLALAKILTGTALPLSATLKVAIGDILLFRLPLSEYKYIADQQLAFLGDVLPLVLLALIATAFLDISSSRKYFPMYIASAAYYVYLFSVLPIMDIADRFQLPLLIGLSFAVPQFYEFACKFSKSDRHVTIVTGMVVILILLGNVAIFPDSRKEARFLASDHSDYAKIGYDLRGIDGLIIASPEAGKLAAASQQKFFDPIGLNDIFVAQNKTKPNYPAALSAYLHNTFGIPDVYIRRYETTDPPYSFLEIMPDFKALYRCNDQENAERTGKTVCVYKDTVHAQQIITALGKSGIRVDLR
ncbi:hypothetical protein WJ542_01020 [Paraburkholderia sp. B3]|uniref:hypothetical protein n=1 Tax=Paraburkholderia sp. B3 TaxID=3134791 RepID=UPI003981CE73